MAKIYSKLIRDSDEFAETFKLRCCEALISARDSSAFATSSDFADGRASVHTQGLRFDKNWGVLDTNHPDGLCVIASYAEKDAGQEFHEYGVEELKNAPVVRESLDIGVNYPALKGGAWN